MKVKDPHPKIEERVVIPVIPDLLAKCIPIKIMVNLNFKPLIIDPTYQRI
jgi:hypothetical protein